MEVPVWVWASLLVLLVLSVLGGDHFIREGRRGWYLACGCLLCVTVIVTFALVSCKYVFVPKALEGRPGYDEPRRSIYNEEFELEVKDMME